MFDPPSMERPDSKNAALQGNRLGNAENNEPTSHLNEAEKDETADQVPELKITTEGEPKKKKKKKPRPKSQRGLDKPTGFEEFHADAPMTPEQFKINQELYSPDLPFDVRIITAIQRFERTRKLTPERRDIFYKYLIYGGFEVSPNAFQGSVDTTEMDSDQVAAAMSHVWITDEKKNLDQPNPKYVVDFEGCMRGFLSRNGLFLYGYETKQQVEMLTTTLERFMDYLLQHDVCPEYKAEVLASRNFCRTALDELWSVAQIANRLPGSFNVACSTLFDGMYGRNYDGQTSWEPEDSKEQVFVGYSSELAMQIMHFGVAGAATEAVYQYYQVIADGGARFEIEEIIEGSGFEVTKIEMPSEECIEMYRSNSDNFKPVGRMYAKAWQLPDAAPEDLTPAEYEAKETEMAKRKSQLREDKNETSTTTPETSGDTPTDYVFLVDADILQHFRIGTRVEATIYKLNCGIHFFDSVLRWFPSFDIYLANELMLGYKEPRMLAPKSDNKAGDEDEGEVGDTNKKGLAEKHEHDNGGVNGHTHIQEIAQKAIADVERDMAALLAQDDEA